MKDQEIFDGFCITLVKKAKTGASYASAEEIVVKSVKNPTKDIEDVKKRGQEFYDDVNKAAAKLFEELTQCIEKELSPDSAKVQSLIKKHHQFIEQFHNATQEVYKAMAQLYEEHPAMRKQLDPFHPQLAEYMAKGMRIFAAKNL